MALPNIFQKEVADKISDRINVLSISTPAQWGKMNVAQMLAHCNVTYEMAFENIHSKPNFMMGMVLKLFVKKIVVSEAPYKKSSPTAPAFIIVDSKNFEAEKSRLISYIYKSQELGENYFDGKESNSFGKLNKIEWNNMFYKHIDHHLGQFGA